MILIFFLIITYLLGAIPFGYIIAKQKHIDIRNVGSGNIGTTNVYRALGIKFALSVGFLDIAKGILPTYIATLVFTKQEYAALVALSAFLGHIFSIYLKGKGGKGFATFAGTISILFGFKLFLLLLITWIVFLYITKLMSFTNLFLTSMTPVLAFLILHSAPYFYYTLSAMVIIWWTHRKNIERLRKGTEKKLTLPRIHF